MRFERLSLEGLLYIAQNLRPGDREEIFACQWNDSPEELAERVFQLSYDFGWILWDDDRPIAAIGAVCTHPGSWSVWMFATPEFPRVRLKMTRFAKNILKPALLDTGHRLECRSLSTHEVAHRWLECLGFSREAVCRKYGRNEETFYLFSLVK